jgi:putative hydrolase of HD superfamily
MENERLKRQIDFIREIDNVKSVYRQTLLMDGKRNENDAEHSWHIAVMAIVLSEYSNSTLDIARVVKMALVHDIVEIYAGDTFCYDEKSAVDKEDRERDAAERIFGMLPADQCVQFRELWDEFEARKTDESKFAAALDRLQPVLHNYATSGAAWRKHGVTSDKVMKRNSHIADGSAVLWKFARELIEDAVARGYFKS